MRLGRGALLVGAMMMAAAAPAQAAKPRFEDFTVTLKGTQERTWTRDYTAYDPCTEGQSRTVGSGDSTMTFRSAKPFRIRALKLDKGSAVLAPAARGQLTAHVEASLRAQGTETHEQIGGHEPTCGDPTGPAPPPVAPDCGTKSFAGGIGLRYVTPAQYPDDPPPLVPVLQLDGITDDSAGFAARDLFRKCPVSETGELLRGPSGSLPLKLLFGSKRRFTVEGRDSATVVRPDRHDHIETTWSATFKRRAIDDGPTACDDRRDNDRDGKTDFPKDPGCKSRADRKE